MPTAAERPALIEKIRRLPGQIEDLTRGLTDEQLDARPTNEWSVRQNVHHLADSHLNAFVRVKLALTETHPTVKPYDQNAWAETIEARSLPVDYSLAILRGLHARWVALFESLDEAGFARTFNHPENGVMSIDNILEYYAAHGEAHIKQINEALAASGHIA